MRYVRKGTKKPQLKEFICEIFVDKTHEKRKEIKGRDIFLKI